MNQTKIAKQYLESIAGAVRSLAEMACTEHRADMLHKITVSLLELEQSTADTVLELELDYAEPELVKTCRKSFRESNSSVITHLEKFQCQGYHFENLIHTLKLENSTLSEEIRLA